MRYIPRRYNPNRLHWHDNAPEATRMCIAPGCEALLVSPNYCEECLGMKDLRDHHRRPNPRGGSLRNVPTPSHQWLEEISNDYNLFILYKELLSRWTFIEDEGDLADGVLADLVENQLFNLFYRNNYIGNSSSDDPQRNRWDISYHEYKNVAFPLHRFANQHGMPETLSLIWESSPWPDFSHSDLIRLEKLVRRIIDRAENPRLRGMGHS